MAGNSVGDEVYLYEDPSKTGKVVEVIRISTDAAGSTLNDYIVEWSVGITTRIDERFVGSLSAKRYAQAMNIIKRQYPQIETDLHQLRNALGWDWKRAEKNGDYKALERVVIAVAKLIEESEKP